MVRQILVARNKPMQIKGTNEGKMMKEVSG